jgi:DNA polymerase-3 subunit gamma/tau
MLSAAAFNALLKTLEEPPPHVKFLFATTDPEKVLPTILSRCQRFDLRRIPAALIVTVISAWIASSRRSSIDPDALLAIARGADGGMRDAESTLDQLISFCGDRIVESDVLSMFGLAARAQLMQLVDAILEGNIASTLRLLDELAGSGKDPRSSVGRPPQPFRNLLLFLVSGAEAGLLDVERGRDDGADPPGRADRCRRPHPRDGSARAAAEGRQREVASKRIFMEVTLLKSIQARESTSFDAVLKQLKTMREQASTGPRRRVRSDRHRSGAHADAGPVPAGSGSVPERRSHRRAGRRQSFRHPRLRWWRQRVPPLPAVPQPLPASPAPVPHSAVRRRIPRRLPRRLRPRRCCSESSQTLEAIWQALVAQVPPSEGLLEVGLACRVGVRVGHEARLTIAHPPDRLIVRHHAQRGHPSSGVAHHHRAKR